MPIDYIMKQESDLIEITPENCQEITGREFKTIISLTGIFGIDARDSFDYDKLRVYCLNGMGDKDVRVDIHHKGVEIECEIRFQFNRLYNKLIRVQDRNCGTGFRIISSQIQHCREASLGLITLFANRVDSPTADEQIGYAVWCKMGFAMINRYHKQYLQQLTDDQLPYEFDRVFDLVHTSYGDAYWREFGFAHYGSFNLAIPSDSDRMYTIYKSKKN